jgi:5-methylcytosine-specific restriction endonuclease McrA
MASVWPYNTLHWRQVRPRVLLRDGRRCQLRFDGCAVAATEVHHIVPPTAGGHPFAADNLQAVCKSCNVSERNRRRAEWARRWAGEEVGPVDVEMIRPW